MLVFLLATSCEIHERKKPIIFSGVVEHKISLRDRLTLLVRKDSVLVEVPVSLDDWENIRYGQRVELDTVRNEFNRQLEYRLKP